MSTIKISAVICTHNNAKLLTKAIESLISQSLNKSLYEILVVDNASIDNTKEVFSRYAHESNVRYVSEPIAGLSHARNTGMREAKGKYIAYIDDDAIASPAWLEKILYGFECVTPTPGSVGGKIEPIWEVPKPSWFPDYKRPYLTILDYGDKQLYLTFPKILYGANMSFDRDILLSVGGFRTDIGRKKRKLIGGEDMDVFCKLANDNVPVLYVPDAFVDHLVPKNRLTKKWLFKRHYWQGRSEVMLQRRRSTKETINEIREAIIKIKNNLRDAKNAQMEDMRFGHQAIIRQQCGRIVQLTIVMMRM